MLQGFRPCMRPSKERAVTDTFDAVLAEMRERANAYPAGVCMDLRVFANRLRDAHHAAIAHGKRANQAAREELDRLAAAHAAEVAERDARIESLKDSLATQCHP